MVEICAVPVRNLLPRAPDPALARVLALASRVVPGLHGELDGVPRPLALRHGAEADDGAPALQALCRHWAAAHPEAGAHHLALRCWGLAIWQPIYLSVIAAHLDACTPRLAGFTQPVVDGFPRGFQLPDHAPLSGDLSARMTAAAIELRVLCDATRAALTPLVALHPRAADRLQAECVLGALLQVHRHALAWREHEVIALGADWLARLGLTGGCGFFAYRARDGTPALALDRQVCCHHFRRAGGEKCSTCPKLPLDTRIARLLTDPP